MIKIVILLKRKEGVSREAFSEHWSGQHARILARLPGMARHVQNHVLPGRNGAEPDYDGVAEGWYADDAAVAALLASDAYKDMLADEPGFIDQAATVILRVREIETALLPADLRA